MNNLQKQYFDKISINQAIKTVNARSLGVLLERQYNGFTVADKEWEKFLELFLISYDGLKSE